MQLTVPKISSDIGFKIVKHSNQVSSDDLDCISKRKILMRKYKKRI